MPNFNIKHFAIIIFFTSLSATVFAQESDLRLEYKVKAAYIYNILKFSHWPDTALASDSKAIHICILGQDDIAEALIPVTSKTALGRSITFETIAVLDQEKRCQVLVITTQQQRQHILRVAESSAMLTVSSQQGFAADGGMIEFAIQHGKVRMVINTAALNHVGIELSSKLLDIATLVTHRVEPILRK